MATARSARAAKPDGGQLGGRDGGAALADEDGQLQPAALRALQVLGLAQAAGHRQRGGAGHGGLGGIRAGGPGTVEQLGQTGPARLMPQAGPRWRRDAARGRPDPWRPASGGRGRYGRRRGGCRQGDGLDLGDRLGHGDDAAEHLDLPGKLLAAAAGGFQRHQQAGLHLRAGPAQLVLVRVQLHPAQFLQRHGHQLLRLLLAGAGIDAEQAAIHGRGGEGVDGVDQARGVRGSPGTGGTTCRRRAGWRAAWTGRSPGRHRPWPGSRARCGPGPGRALAELAAIVQAGHGCGGAAWGRSAKCSAARASTRSWSSAPAAATTVLAVV